MKKLIFLTVIISWTTFSFAQEKNEYKVKDFPGNIYISGSVGGLIIEGYDGNDVIIEAEATDHKVPEKAKGLKLVTPGGIDNTGLGINVENQQIQETPGTSNLVINFPNDNKFFKNYRIKIPAQNNLNIKADTKNIFVINTLVTVNSMAGELEINCTWCDINVTDFSGNIVSNTSFGETYIEFSKYETSKPSYINGSNKDIEVILPSKVKADVRLSGGAGNTFTDFDLEAAVQTKPNQSDEIVVVGKPSWDFDFKNIPGIEVRGDTIRILSGDSLFSPSERIKMAQLDDQIKNIKSLSVIKKEGKPKSNYIINGGGTFLSIKNFQGNIYLRKK